MIKKFNEMDLNEKKQSQRHISSIPAKVNNDKVEKVIELLKLLGVVDDSDIMFHDERKEYFFEWYLGGNFKTIWLNDYVI
jgi:hypothetical protein